MDKAQRLVGLACAVASARQPIDRPWIGQNVEGFDGENEAARKRIHRDFCSLEEIGVRIGWLPMGGLRDEGAWVLLGWNLKRPEIGGGLLQAWRMLTMASEAGRPGGVDVVHLCRLIGCDFYGLRDLAEDLLLVGAPPYMPHDYFDFGHMDGCVIQYSGPNVSEFRPIQVPRGAVAS